MFYLCVFNYNFLGYIIKFFEFCVFFFFFSLKIKGEVIWVDVKGVRDEELVDFILFNRFIKEKKSLVGIGNAR